ncbi:MAG: sugar-transfer associated ATP-grasp domain-containing protein [Bacteroidales bacterium]|nr:sugar-transfer associated ATP-grasp domain-containing protein [Bacteroidales bacterium]
MNSQGEVVILGSRLRISVNSSVDNMAAGNIAAPIDDETGTIYGPAVYGDITRPDEVVHPVTGISIIGFQIPYWKETIELVKRAATMHTQNRSIGWDIAMTDEGPDLIEGNHDWCKLVWQLPVKKGLKPVLEMHAEEYKKTAPNSL